MNPIFTALEDPLAWSEVSTPKVCWWMRLFSTPPIPDGDMYLRHRSGIRARIKTNGALWIVWDPVSQKTVARLPRTNDAVSLPNFQADLDRIYGARIRARVDQFLQQAYLTCLQAGARGSVLVVVDPTDPEFGHAYKRHDPVPVADCSGLLSGEFSDLKIFLRPSNDGTTLTVFRKIRIDLPSTQHKALSILAQARQDGLIA